MISTHVLDVSRGRPAEGIAVSLEHRDGPDWRAVGQAATDADGRAKDLTAGAALTAGEYRLILDTGAYFASQQIATLYPEIVIVFEAVEGQSHYHVPVLLSPFGYTTYRGT